MLDHHTILSLAFAQRIDLRVGMLVRKWYSFFWGRELVLGFWQWRHRREVKDLNRPTGS